MTCPHVALVSFACKSLALPAATVTVPPVAGLPLIAVYTHAFGNVAGPSFAPKLGTSPGEQYAFSVVDAPPPELPLEDDPYDIAPCDVHPPAEADCPHAAEAATRKNNMDFMILQNALRK